MKNFRNLMYLVFAVAMIVACDKKENKGEGSTDSTATGVDSSAVTSTLKIDTTKSDVKWLGKKVTGEHKGTVKVKGGELQITGDSLTGGTVEVNMTSIAVTDLTDKTMNDKLVGHLKSDDFFGVAKNPTATLVIKNVQPGADGKLVVSGDLTIKGITKPVNFPADINVSNDKVTAKGTAVINRTDFDVRYGSKKFFEDIGDKMIYDEFELEFDVTAVK
jgi:polyisoprenoid-binding protein YceI